jgi:hypothetical protein
MSTSLRSACENPLYANPLINKVMKKLYEDDRSVIYIKGETWLVFYPMEKKIEDIEGVNRRIKKYGHERALKEIVVQGHRLSDE